MPCYLSNVVVKNIKTDEHFAETNERFMAANDLMMELQKDSIKLDEESERKVVTMLLKLLEDKNGEVQNLAVKWYLLTQIFFRTWTLWFVITIISGSCSLGPLVGKVKECQVEMMVDTLCSNMVSNKEQLRDISSMGLKTVIAELPSSSAGIMLIL